MKNGQREENGWSRNRDKIYTAVFGKWDSGIPKMYSIFLYLCSVVCVSHPFSMPIPHSFLSNCFHFLNCLLCAVLWGTRPIPALWKCCQSITGLTHIDRENTALRSCVQLRGYKSPNMHLVREETTLPRGNPSRHTENMQNSTFIPENDGWEMRDFFQKVVTWV